MSDEVADTPEPRWGTRGTAGAVIAGQLAFEDVSLSVASQTIVQGVTFSIEPGEIVCLLGPSGCGKTSLLRVAAGILRATSGRVLLDGSEIDGPKRFLPPEKRNVGMVFQDFALFPHLTAVQNVAFGLHMLERKEALKIATLMLERVGLTGFRNVYPGALSGGEQQRVALARAMVPRPKVMLLDEPFSGLDQRLRDSVRSETLALLKETRASCVLVTHDPLEALEFADRIMLMRRGRLVQTGKPADFFERPIDLHAARFFSDVNEVAGMVRGDALETPLGRFRLTSHIDGNEGVAVIRPEGVRLARKGEQGTEGLIIDRRYLGDRTRLVMRFAGVESDINALVTGQAPEKGETANVRFDAAAVLTFTRDSADYI